ncbi:jg22430, partial [Pararge aegeria aegeria]
DAGAAPEQSKRKSKLEQLAELRDLRRRRVKYRVAVHSRNYSHTLRALIDTQMEMYVEAQGHVTKPHDASDYKYPKTEKQPAHSSDENDNEHRGSTKKHRYDSDRKNDHSEHRRKRVSYDDNHSRKYEIDRRQTSAEERITHDRDRRRKQDGTKDGYKEERDVEKRKRAYEDHTNAQAFEKGRYKTSRVEREKSEDNDESRRQDSYRDYCRKEKDVKHNREKNLERTSHTKEEKDIYRSSSIDSHRGRESEKEGPYYKDKDKNGIKKDTVRSKRDRYSSSTRDIQKYRGSEWEVRYDKDKARNDVKQE